MICVECESCFSIALNDIYELSPGRGTESGLWVQAGRGTGQLLTMATHAGLRVQQLGLTSTVQQLDLTSTVQQLDLNAGQLTLASR